jgi:cobalt-zinc-cadmium efflux system outer membrane protein
MPPQVLAFVIFLIHSPLLLFAATEIQYSPDFVDPATGMTLAEIWKQATLTNPDTQAANRRVLEAKGLRKQATVFPNPELQVHAGTSSILGEPGDREWGATVVQTFELGGKRSKRIRAADISVQIAEQELRERQRQVRWELQQAFAEMLAAAANIHTTQQALVLNQKSHEITLARVQQGETASVEQAVSEVELNRLKADLAASRAEGTRVFSKVKTLTGVAQPMKIRAMQFESVSGDWNVDQLITRALSSRPDFQLALLQTELTEAEVALAWAEGVSDLAAFVQYTNERSAFDQLGIDPSGNPVPLIDQDQNLSAGLSIQLPLFNRNQGNTKAAEAKADAAKIRKATLETTIRQEVQVAVERLKIAQSNLTLFRESILDQSQKQLSVLQASYRAGEFRFLDLINEQRRVLEIQKSYINATKEYLISAAELEFVISSSITGRTYE